MLTFSRSAWPHRAAALLALLTLTAACSSNEPTAAEAGQTLKAHVLGLLRERGALDVTITDPGGKNNPCGNGKARQTFAATGMDAARETTPENVRSLLLGALERVAPYKIVNAEPLSEPVHVVDSETHTLLTLDSPANGMYAVSGQTECLSS